MSWWVINEPPDFGVSQTISKEANVGTNDNANADTNVNANANTNTNVDTNVDSNTNANVDSNININTNVNVNTDTNVDVNTNTNVDVDANANTCDVLKSGGPLIIHQPAECLWVLCNSIPQRCVPFTRTQNLTKSDRVSFIRGALSKTQLVQYTVT